MPQTENPSYLSVVQLRERFSMVVLSWVDYEKAYFVVHTSRRRHKTKEQAIAQAEQQGRETGMEVRL
jgi:hypothetical protein